MNSQLNLRSNDPKIPLILFFQFYYVAVSFKLFLIYQREIWMDFYIWGSWGKNGRGIRNYSIIFDCRLQNTRLYTIYQLNSQYKQHPSINPNQWATTLSSTPTNHPITLSLSPKINLKNINSTKRTPLKNIFKITKIIINIYINKIKITYRNFDNL